MDIHVQFAKEWAVISTAPLSFVIASWFTIFIVWAALQWGYRSVLASKDGEISLLQGQKEDYLEKLSGRSPDHFVSELARLRQEIEYLKSPPREQNGVYHASNLLK